MTFSPPSQPPSVNQRPQRLATVLILVGILEGVVIAFSLYSLIWVAVQLVFGPINTAPSNPGMEKYLEAVFAASLPVVQLPVLCVQVLLSATLLYLTVQVFRGVGEEVGRLSSVLGVALGFTPAKFLFYAFVQLRIYPVLNAHLGALTPVGTAAPPPGFEDMMSTILAVSMVLGIALNVVVLASKLFLYTFTRATLRREDSQRYFLARRARLASAAHRDG